MQENNVNQLDNEIGRDLAGRDITYDQSVQFNQFSRQSETPLQMLFKKLELEKTTNPQLTEFIEELNYYYNKVDGDVIGLEQKLKDGKQENLVDYALRVKEAYHKKLYKHQFSEVSQQINLYLLALVESYFTNHIYPKICNGHSSEQISSLIQEQVINPLLNQLNGDTLGFTAKDINGMIYFLTGNCHIQWSKKNVDLSPGF
jgi:hypothetical protein